MWYRRHCGLACAVNVPRGRLPCGMRRERANRATRTFPASRMLIARRREFRGRSEPAVRHSKNKWTFIPAGRADRQPKYSALGGVSSSAKPAALHAFGGNGKQVSAAVRTTHLQTKHKLDAALDDERGQVVPPFCGLHRQERGSGVSRGLSRSGKRHQHVQPQAQGQRAQRTSVRARADRRRKVLDHLQSGFCRREGRRKLVRALGQIVAEAGHAFVNRIFRPHSRAVCTRELSSPRGWVVVHAVRDVGHGGFPRGLHAVLEGDRELAGRSLVQAVFLDQPPPVVQQVVNVGLQLELHKPPRL